MGLRSEPQHWGPTGQIKARGVGAVGRVTGETRRTGTGNDSWAEGMWAGEGVSGPQGEGLRDPDGQCAPEDQVGGRSGGRAQEKPGQRTPPQAGARWLREALLELGDTRPRRKKRRSGERGELGAAREARWA